MRMGSKKSVFVCHASQNTTLYNSKVTNSTHPHKEKKKRNQLSLVTARKDSENTIVYQKIREVKGGRERKVTAYTELNKTHTFENEVSVLLIYLLLLLLC